MKKSKILTFLLTGALIGSMALFGACSNTNNPNETPGDDTSGGVSNTPGGTVVTPPAGSKSWTFEAEEVYIDPGLVGPGYSGAVYGSEIVQSAVTFNGSENVNSLGASGDYFVTYLFGEGITLDFQIVSSKAITGASLVLRVAGEFTLSFTDTEYTVEVNGTALKYGSINVQRGSANGVVSSFKDVQLGSIDLKEGVNTIKLITSNHDTSVFNGAGTYGAKAPVVDCIKIITEDSADINLSWDAAQGYPFTNHT